MMILLSNFQINNYNKEVIVSDKTTTATANTTPKSVINSADRPVLTKPGTKPTAK